MKRLAVSLAVALVSLPLWSTTAVAGTYNVYVCGPWSSSTQPFVPAASSHASYSIFGCGGGADALMNVHGGANAPNGANASWTTTAPPGLSITHIYTVGDSGGNVGDGHGWWGEFFWNGGPGLAGRSAQITDSFSTYGCCQALFNNQTVGWFISCAAATCTLPADLNVGGVDLTVDELSGPWLAAPSGLWQAPGWVRGDVTLGFYGDSPSGVCGLGATINGQIVANSNSPRNQTTWHQCSAPPISQTLHTIDYGQGSMPLTISGLDAAGVPVNYTKTIRIDNQQPTVALTGPADAPSTAGTQYVTATATAGPSGVAGISCAVDGGTASWYPTATAQVPVSGVGQHVVQCFSESNARDGSGTPGVSAMRSFSMSIRVPTISGIAFTAIADRLRCHRVQKRIRVPARTVIVRRHHKRVRVRRPAHTKIVHVTKCHPRTIIKHRIVIVTIHRHGKKVRVRRRKTIHVIVLPHPVLKLKRRVAFGHGTTVSGWLGTYDGVALAGQAVEVLSAPDNGGGSFTPVAWATTASNGGWSAQIPAGPSRLIEADYGGAANRGAVAIGPGDRDGAGEGEAAARRAATRGVGRNREDHAASWSAATCPPAARWCGCGSAWARRERPTASRSTSRATAGSQPPTRSARGTREFTARTGSSSPRCRWATIRSRPRTRRGGSCASAGIRRSGRTHHRHKHRRHHRRPP